MLLIIQLVFSDFEQYGPIFVNKSNEWQLTSFVISMEQNQDSVY